MNINFNLVWFENEGSTIQQFQEDVKALILKHSFLPNIIIKKNGDFTLDDIENADLLLVDYNMGTTTNIEIMKSIRGGNFFNDALLYSSTFDDMVTAIQNENPFLEGIFCGDRIERKTDEDEYWLTKLDKLIGKAVKRFESIGNLRGIITEYASIFEIKIIQLVLKMSLNKEILEETKIYLNNKIAKHFKDNAYKNCRKEKINCKNNCKNAKKGCEKMSGCCLTHREFNVLTEENLREFDFYTKARILNNILQFLFKTRIIDDEYVNFLSDFNEGIIVYRNALAHQDIIDTLQIKLNEKSETVKIDQLFYIKVRKTIMHFIQIFQELDSISLN